MRRESCPRNVNVKPTYPQLSLSKQFLALSKSTTKDREQYTAQAGGSSKYVTRSKITMNDGTSRSNTIMVLRSSVRISEDTHKLQFVGVPL